MGSSSDELPPCNQSWDVPAKISGGVQAGGVRAGVKVFGPEAVSILFVNLYVSSNRVHLIDFHF